MTHTQWKEIRFTRGFQEFVNAWQQNAGNFSTTGDALYVHSDDVVTNLPNNVILDFRRMCAPGASIHISPTDAPENEQ